MRHGKRFNHLGRKPAHRKATLSNMASSLILHKRISTTVAKAKALRKYVEPIITRSKDDTTHSRRMVFKYLQDKESVKELFGEIADKVANRPGGYTRIIKTGNRLGDNADMCIMELVDFNELLLEEAASAKPKTRRGRRKKKAGDSDQPKAAAPVATEEAVVEAEEVAGEDTAEAVVDEAVVEETPGVEEAEAVEETAETVEEEPVAEEAAEEVAPEAETPADEEIADVTSEESSEESQEEKGTEGEEDPEKEK